MCLHNYVRECPVLKNNILYKISVACSVIGTNILVFVCLRYKFLQFSKISIETIYFQMFEEIFAYQLYPKHYRKDISILIICY